MYDMVYTLFRMSKKGKKIDLFGDEDEGGGGLSINKDYAERYENWRKLEEMQKMKDKYGADFDKEPEESSDSEESEDGAGWTADDEKDFLRTLSALKGGDERIYNAEARFWHDKSDEPNTSKSGEDKKLKKKDEKPMFLKDYERALVERGGDIDVSDGEGEEGSHDAGYYSKQEQNKRALKLAMSGGVKEDDEGEDDLLVPRAKTDEEKKREEDEYYEWIAGNKDKVIEENEAKELKSLKKAWSNASKLDADEKFLRDYILNKQYDTDRDGASVPSYEEIVGTTLDEDEAEEERGRQFERKYNFRYEEPDQEFIKQYPRTIAQSVREGVNNKRKEQRTEIKERKAREKEEKIGEIRQMKKMMKSEIEKKLEKLKKMAGGGVAVRLDDLEGDFDPKEYDKRMQELFNNEYYDVPVEGDVDELEKPVFSDLSDDDIDDGDDDYDDMQVRGGHDDDEEEEEDEGEDKKATKTAMQTVEETLRKDQQPSRRRRKRNAHFVEAIRRDKPLFDPKDKTFEEYFNEYYSLDYEDIIGDTRTRFKYRSVPANSFGLTTEEILAADDRQLNAWASVKKAVAYRTDKEEEYDINAYARKGRDEAKKKRILSTDFGGKRSKKLKEAEEKAKKETEEANGERTADTEEQVAENGEEEKKKKKKRNRKKNKNKKTNGEDETSTVATEENGNDDKNDNDQKEEVEPTEEKASEGGKKVRSRKRNRVDKVNVGVADDRLRAYGINVKKFKAKAVYGKKKKEEVTE